MAKHTIEIRRLLTEQVEVEFPHYARLFDRTAEDEYRDTQFRIDADGLLHAVTVIGTAEVILAYEIGMEIIAPDDIGDWMAGQGAYEASDAAAFNVMLQAAIDFLADFRRGLMASIEGGG